MSEKNSVKLEGNSWKLAKENYLLEKEKNFSILIG